MDSTSTQVTQLIINLSFLYAHLLLHKTNCSPGNFIRIFLVLNSFVNYHPDNCSKYCIRRSKNLNNLSPLQSSQVPFNSSRNKGVCSITALNKLSYYCAQSYLSLSLSQSNLEYTKSWYGNVLYSKARNYRPVQDKNYPPKINFLNLTVCNSCYIQKR